MIHKFLDNLKITYWLSWNFKYWFKYLCPLVRAACTCKYNFFVNMSLWPGLYRFFFLSVRVCMTWMWRWWGYQHYLLSVRPCVTTSEPGENQPVSRILFVVSSIFMKTDRYSWISLFRQSMKLLKCYF